MPHTILRLPTVKARTGLSRSTIYHRAEAAKTWRKKNAALIMATQSAVDVTGTAGAEALLEPMPTKLFLANPELPDKAADIFRLTGDSPGSCRARRTPGREGVHAPRRAGRQGRVENAFFRYKSIIGDGLRARPFSRHR